MFQTCSLSIIFDDKGDKYWIMDGLDELDNILNILTSYQSLNLTIVRTSWSQDNGNRVTYIMSFKLN